MKTDDIIKGLIDYKKKCIKMYYIMIGFLSVFVVVCLLAYFRVQGNYLRISLGIIVLIIFVVAAMIKMKNSIDKKVEVIKSYENEIDTHCEAVDIGLYATNNRLIEADNNLKPVKVVEFSKIVSCENKRIYDENSTNGTPIIIITTNDNKKVTLHSNNRLEEILSNFFGKESNNKGKYIESSDINDFYQFDDHYEGYINVPVFNVSRCYTWIDSDVTPEYANMVASLIKSLTYNDIQDALESSIWYYNNDLKEYGYHPESCKVPLRVNKEEMYKNIKLNSIYISKVNDNVPGFVFEFKISEVPEENFTWVIKEKNLIYVGRNGADYDFSNNKNNFVKGYHDPVTLTEEEYRELEEKGKITR